MKEKRRKHVHCFLANAGLLRGPPRFADFQFAMRKKKKKAPSTHTIRAVLQPQPSINPQKKKNAVVNKK